MLRGKEQKVIGHSPAWVRKISEAHLRAYGPDDIEILMQSVSPQGGIWAGLAPPHGATLLQTTDEIRGAYTHLLAAVNVGASKIFNMICTDWYAVFEGISAVEDKASGQIIENRSICLFGADDKALAVDMAWPFATTAPIRPARKAQHACSELDDLLAHTQRMAGWLAGDVDAACTGLADQGFFFVPCFDPNDARLELMAEGRAGYRAFMQSFFALYRVRSITQTNILIADQYVFSDYTLELDGVRDRGALTVRYALVEILDERGAICGMLGLATKF